VKTKPSGRQVWAIVNEEIEMNNKSVLRIFIEVGVNEAKFTIY
jgi:hypothetical protein